MSALPRVMLVTDRHATNGRELPGVVAQAAQGGAGLIQLREKDLDPVSLGDLLEAILAAVREKTRVIVNGRPELARARGCGLHLPAAAPRCATEDLPLVGRSAHDPEECVVQPPKASDYVILGPVYPTDSKPGHPGCGIELVRTIAGELAPLPLFAIGGVTATRAIELREAGAYGVAVRGAILSAPDPAIAARELVEATGH